MPVDSSHFQSLTAQVTARIAAALDEGTWVDWLPGERALTETLRVSRKTVRKALAQLKRDGRLSTQSGQGHRIVQKAHAVSRPEISVGLLTLEPLEHLRPYTTFWIDELRILLFERQAHLTTFSGRRFFTARAGTELSRLVRQNPQTCWVLAHTDERIQQWFHDHAVPCLIAGSCHRGLPLCNVDIDFFAVCRHAVGTMRRQGHRRLALLIPQSQRAGDLESEAGFTEGAKAASLAATDTVIARHDGTVQSTLNALHRLFSRPTSPTAILIVNPAYYLTTVSFLASRGLRVPTDVSLVCRDNDSYLSFLSPEPARYSCSPKTYAKRLLSAVVALTEGGTPTPLARRIEPDFIRGASLAKVG